jgi:hypothetical protein
MAVTMICARCGSDNVVKDAYARWNVTHQKWELSAVFDASFCEACDGEETRLKEAVLSDTPE